MHRSYYFADSVVSLMLAIAISFILCYGSADGQCPTADFSCLTVNGTTNSEMIQFAVSSNIYASIETLKIVSNGDVYIWRFDTQAILTLLYFNGWSPTIDPLYTSRVMKYSQNVIASGIRLNITIANIKPSETMLLVSYNRGGASAAFSLRILECNTTVFPGATTSGSGVCGYGCNRTFVCDDPGYVNKTLPTKFCLADATWSDEQGCDLTPNPPLPGWAIFLIILGALVLVFAVLFIVWWCFPGFRECLHGVSECFPEDHCCGKGSC